MAGVHATGEVIKEEMETVLIPLLDDLVKRKDKINYILVLETPVQNFTASAWWDDVKLGLKNFTHWNRIAIVSDQKAVEFFSTPSGYLSLENPKDFRWMNCSRLMTGYQSAIDHMGTKAFLPTKNPGH